MERKVFTGIWFAYRQLFSLERFVTLLSAQQKNGDKGLAFFAKSQGSGSISKEEFKIPNSLRTLSQRAKSQRL
jgi:hypothetical protein